MCTVAIDFKVKEVVIKGVKVRLNIFDTAGQERFAAIVSSYYRGAQGALIVFAWDDHSSFEGTINWVTSVRKDHPEMPMVLVGNKSDLPATVKCPEVEAMAERLGISAFSCSALTGEGVDSAFERLAVLALEGAKDVPKPVQVRKETYDASRGDVSKRCCPR